MSSLSNSLKKKKNPNIMGRMYRVFNPRAYLQVNIPAILMSFFTYILWEILSNKEWNNFFCLQNIMAIYIIATLKGYFYVIYLYIKFDKRKKYFTEIHKEMESNRTLVGHLLMCCIRTSFSATLMATLNGLGGAYFFGIRNEFTNNQYINGITFYDIFVKLFMFIIQMFCWEIWFDFGHYWGHRFGHYCKTLYDFGHSKHHENVSPDAFDGLNITFDDALLTNWIPHMFSLFMTTCIFFPNRPFSLYEMHLLSSYKTFVEVTGHVGVDFKGHSFPIFPPLSYYTGIDIGTAAYHSLHHRYYTVNYSKRFTLWDRVFHTMMVPPVLDNAKSKKEENQELIKAFSDKRTKKMQ
mmetsp:Transcript_97013/g.118800  ORF Transcript_97013/g.118800 Transcript_97013/m.118800 type:complete len:351 (+) Transcript_97013:37-1089(+)